MRRLLPWALLLTACAGTCEPDEAPATAPPAPVAAQPVLDETGTLPGSGRMHFEVNASPGDHLEVRVSSTDFDPVLQVTPPGGGTLTNDDWQGRRDEARLSLVAAEAGALKIEVGRADQRAGAFHLTVHRATTTGQDATTLAVGATHAGTLDATDGALADGRFSEWVTVAGADAGQLELRIEAQGAAVPLAIVLDPSGTALSGAQGRYVLWRPGTHRVQLIAPVAGQPAGYRMSLRALQQQVVPTLARAHHQLPTGTTGAPLQLGQTVQGRLGGGTSLPSGEPASLFALQGRAGQRARFELRSTDFDTYLMVVAPTGQHWENDDTAGTTNSAIDVEFPADGLYRVVASAYRAGMAGAFELKASQPPDATGQAARAALGALRPPAPSTASVRPRTQRGELGPGDATLRSGEWHDTYEFDWPADADLEITATSTAFDTYLIVRPPQGDQQDNDDPEEGDTNARLRVHTERAGTYQVVVTSYRPGEQGPYELRIAPAAASSGPSPAQPPPAPSPGVGDAERILRGELAAGDTQLPSGEFVDTFPLSLRTGQSVHLEARSSAFDTYLILREPGGAQHDNDDGPNGTDAALDFVATAAGRYTVSVTSYRPGETGAYELAIRDGASGTPSAATPAPPASARPSAATGDRVRGSLAQGDTTLPSGEFSDEFVRRFTPGEPVAIRLTSTDFDPYLIVRTPSGRQLDNDDLTPSTRDAGIDLPAAEAGDYRLTVTSYQPGETGAYELRFGAGQAGARPDATGGEGGRVFGLFAGITDYPAGVGDLPECANDAIKLAQALREADLLTEDRQVLLTDGEATGANLRRGLQRLTSRMGPDDIFVFFYSGHGGQRPGSGDPREIDGTDEFLVLHDGPLLDDELSRLFEPVRARISVVALDACYSGGFAKDLITRPGRVGFFSSEEDVLSSVAGQFQAGGYLSHFIRLAVSGQADRAPADRVLTVGELSHFLYRQFGQHATDVQLQGAFQHLVVDRGAVGSDQVLWSYR